MATALAAALIGAPVATAAAPVLASAAAKPKAQDTETTTETERNAKAAAEAKRTGKRVEIVAERTESEELWANPDGSFTTEQAVVPVRVHRNGKLVPVDTGLAKQKDGRIAAKATRSGLTFSGGGTSPLVTMRKDGRDISLSWPKPLPAPTVDGSAATYAEVLKGVDLRVEADANGFTHQLVVKNREAAANPELASIDFSLKGNGVTVRKEANGELNAVDPSGRTLFSSAKPQMWDSGADKPAAAGAAGTSAKDQAEAAAAGAKAATGSKAALSATETPDTPVTPVTPVADQVPAVDGISLGTSQADLGVALKGDKLTLTTDRALLTGEDTDFPVVIDPKWRDDWKSAYTIAYKHNGISGTADTNYWNGGTLSKEARVGCAKDAQKGNAVVCAKTFFQVPMGAVHGKKIMEATLRIQQKSAGSWSCNSGDIQVWDTGTISKATTWNKQPNWTRLVSASGASYGGRNCPGDGDTIELDVKSAVADAAQYKWGSWTLGLKAARDTVDVSWRKLNPDSLRISTKYNTVPDPVTGRTMNPYVPCAGGTIGKTDQIVLSGKVQDDEDNLLKAEFHFWRADDYNGTLKKVFVDRASGNVASATILGPFSGTYKWDVRVSDGTDAGPWAGQCTLNVDATKPGNPPEVVSAQYPADDVANQTLARTEGTFDFKPNKITDIAKYQWHTADNPTVKTVNATSVGGPAQIKYTPTAAGPHTLYVWSLDAAGNRSDTTSYTFHAKRPPERDKHGDTNGDGITDIWSVDPGDGSLWFVPGKGGAAFGIPRKTPQGKFSSAVSLTQWGSWNGGDFYEDLVVLQPSADDPTLKKLYVYPSTGNGDLQLTDAHRVELTATGPNAGSDQLEKADQIVAISSVNDDIAVDAETGDGVIDEKDNPDLLVRTGDELWLYFGFPTGTLGKRGLEPVRLGNLDWANMTLAAPGDLNGDGLPEIWARENTNGKIHQYTSKKTTDTAAKSALDLTVYADPAVRTTTIGTEFFGTAWPQLASLGDFEKDGFPDLWARDQNGVIYEFQGRAPIGGNAFSSARQVAVSGTPWTECESVPGVTTGSNHQLCGPILSKYKAKGGTAFGKPSGNIATTADGGKYVHLRGTGYTSDNISIYWHPSTGAWSLQNGIRNKWIALGAQAGFLGYPTSDEDSTFDETGAFTTFTGSGGNGAIYWSPETGSWSIHGNIYARYLLTGGPSRLGYPTTDETATTDGKSRYNHFRPRGQTSDTASIYWLPGDKGSWPVFGSIRAKWLAVGGGGSYLGYPTSGEYDIHSGIRADFEGGYIRHDRVSGVTLDHKPADRTAHLRHELAGDFNGDGLSDLATVYDLGASTIGLYVQSAEPSGEFANPDLAYVSGKGHFSFAESKWVAGDFNGDGRSDIAALYGYADGSNGMFTWLSQADGTFKVLPRSAYIAPGNWTASKGRIVAGDFNGDKRDDVAMFYDQGSGASGLHTFLSNADGSFKNSVASWRSANNAWTWGLGYEVAGDFNGDGRDDILAIYSGNAKVTAYTMLGKADGGFAAPIASWTRNQANWNFAKTRWTAGDYNGDGRDDLGAFYDYDGGSSGLFTMFGKTDGGVTNEDFRSWFVGAGQWYSSSTGHPASGDTDGDGREDITFMYNYAVGKTSAFTYKAKADGGFSPYVQGWTAEPGLW